MEIDNYSNKYIVTVDKDEIDEVKVAIIAVILRFRAEVADKLQRIKKLENSLQAIESGRDSRDFEE